MTVRNLEAVFSPTSVALIGASTRPNAVGAVVAKNLLTAGFAGLRPARQSETQMGDGRAVLFRTSGRFRSSPITR